MYFLTRETNNNCLTDIGLLFTTFVNRAEIRVTAIYSEVTINNLMRSSAVADRPRKAPCG